MFLEQLCVIRINCILNVLAKKTVILNFCVLRCDFYFFLPFTAKQKKQKTK